MSHRPASLRPEDLLEHLDWARALARKLVLDTSTADDVVQDSFASALRTPPAGALAGAGRGQRGAPAGAG